MALITALLVLLASVKLNSAVIMENYFSSSAADCDKFFHGSPWPMPKGIKSKDVVKLCQVQRHENVLGPLVFATLFNTNERIPVYTANTVVLYDTPDLPRPDEEYWKRLAFGLCNLDKLPEEPILSDIHHMSNHSNHTEYENCRRLQAACEDYKDNELNLDRGHLSPNSINSQNLEKQRGTFTLTNAAPQFAKFNRNSWREYECVTEHSIINLVPGEVVYILTGTYGTAVDSDGKPLWLNGNETSDSDKNPVKVPGYYWKAVCYPGSSSKLSWGYAIVKKNVNLLKSADYESYITLKEFAQKYFEDLPFGPDCMNAGFGEFSHIFSNWVSYLHRYCAEIDVEEKTEL